MAANRIKGITIEIDGNTTKLQDSLKDVDKQLRTTQTSLKDINKLLKLDPGNTELVAQKQKTLREAIDLTKKRLNELKNAQTDALSPEQYDALQREIIETEQNLESLQGQYDELAKSESGALESAGKSIENAGAKISKAGEAVSKVGDGISSAGKKIAPVSGAVAGIGAAAISSAKELDEGYDLIIQKTGATGKEAENLQKQMDNVFTSIPTSADKAGAAIGDVATRFNLTDEALGKVSTSFLKFAEINNTDVSSAIDNVDGIMEKFALDTEDVDGVLGAMTATSQKTGVSIDTLETSLNKNGATMKEMGLSIGSSINLLGQFEQNGIESSTAMTALGKANQYAVKQGKSMNTVLKSAVTSIKGAKSETDALSIATEVFGKKGATEMTQAIREGRFSLDDLNLSIDDYADTVEKTYQETIDPWDEMTVATNNLKVAGAELAGSLFDTLKPVLDDIVGAVKEFTTWFSHLDEGQRKTIVTIGLIVAAAAPLLILLGSVISSVGSIIKVGGTLVSGIGKVVTVISSGGGLISALGSLATAAAPFLIGGAVIAGIIAGIVLIVKNWDSIKKGLDGLWKGIKAFAGKVKEGVKGLVSSIGSGIGQMKQSIGSKMNEIKTSFLGTWDGIKTQFGSTWDSIKNKVSQNVQSILTAFGSFRAKVGSIFSSIISAITSPFQKAWAAIMEFVGKIKNAFKFKIELPKIKLPHITVKWNKVGDFFKIPTLSVKWYKKAYNNPMMFNNPTVLQTPSGFKGFGDGRGGEMVYGRDNLMRDIRSAVSDMSGITVIVNGAPGQDVNQLADAVSRRLATLQRQRATAYVS